MAVQTGNGNDTVNLNGNSAAVTIQTGTGTSAVNVTATGAAASISNPAGSDTITLGSDLADLAGPLTITGDTADALIFNDTAAITAETGTLSNAALTGFGSAGVNFTGVATLAANLGANDALTVGEPDGTLTAFATPLTVTGTGAAALKLNDAAATPTKSVSLTATAVAGLSATPIQYADLATLNLNLGSGVDNVAVTSTAANTTTTINGNTYGESTHLTTGALAGPLVLAGNGTDPLTIDDTADLADQSVAITANQITGLGAAVTYTGMETLSLSLGSGNDSLSMMGLASTLQQTTIDGGPGTNVATVNLPGNLPGNLALTHFQDGAITIAGNVNGTLSTDGNLSSVHILGGMQAGSHLNVTGVLKQIEVDGTAAGSVNVGSLEGVIEPSVSPSADGTIFTLTTGGVTRSIQAIPAGTGTLTGDTFSVVYDATDGEPQAAVRVDGGNSNQRFDLLLNAPAGSTFSLSRLDSVNDATTNVRNVVVDGDILGNVTPAEAGYFGYAAGVAGGVQLPQDHLGAVSAQDNMVAGAIRAVSVQGYSFAQLLGLGGVATDAPTIAVSAHSEKLLLSALMTNPATGKAYTAVVIPTEPLLVAAGTANNHAVLFAGRAGVLSIDPSGFVLWDRDASQVANAELTFSGAYNAGRETVTTLTWQGTGGSVQTRRVVSNITSTGALGDTYLAAGPAEKLDSLIAPGIEGDLNLFGGKLVGTIRTTGDLGTANGSSTIALQTAPTARIVSGGSLFSDIAISGNFAGTIAAGQDIDANIDVSGGGRSTGQIVALGAINGNVHVAGSYAGQIAAGSATGIHGNIAVDHGIAKGGAVVSAGEIGDAAAGTYLTTPSVVGKVEATGVVRLQAAHVPKSPHLVQAGNGASAIASLWNDNGVPISIDGLATIESRLKQMARAA